MDFTWQEDMTKTKLQYELVSAEQLNLSTVFISVNHQIEILNDSSIVFEPKLKIVSITKKDNGFEVVTELQKYDENYSVSINKSPFRMLNPDRWLNTLYSDKKMGYQVKGNETFFAVFAPRASKVNCVIFDSPSSENFTEKEMKRDENGVWELSILKDLTGKAYGYRVFGKQDSTEWFNPNIVIADPYSPAVTTVNTYHHQARTLILKTNFNWENDTFVNYPHREAIILEAHLRDLTADKSSQSSQPGTYLGLIDENQTGGLPYIKKLGVNTIEFLPLQEFGNIEIPFGKPSDNGIVNTWNYYSRNHWGYMTSYFFAPENYYGSGGNMNPGQRVGTEGKAVTEFKQMVKKFHQEKISVFMDVVYNHVSQYDYNPFKLIDKKYYFRLDNNFNALSVSGCGNDFKTERPMARKMIVESIKHWMTEYHVDGFRFDLAQLIDKETCRQILSEAKKLNPHVMIIAEPWGGGYDPNGFSDIGWSSWNDQIRNGIKGWNPGDFKKGFIFGQFRDGTDYMSLVRWIRGSLREDGGQYLDVNHSVNYIESHDDATFGDFLREALEKIKPHEKISDIDKNAKLSTEEMRLHKLAAMFLFTSQGAVMIHSGQEFGRSKVIVKTSEPETRIGEIDHNTYDKDNETNYINYDQSKLNSELVDFYSSLINFRKTYKILTNASKKELNFYPYPNPLVLVYEFDGSSLNEPHFLVLMNGDRNHHTEIKLPEGKWKVLFTNADKSLTSVSGHLILRESDGYIFVRE